MTLDEAEALFLAQNILHIKNALDKDFAEEWVQYSIKNLLQIDESDPESWSDEINSLNSGDRNINIETVAPFTWDIICRLLGGPDAIDTRTRQFSNGFNINANVRANEPWQGPSQNSTGWHKDGWFFKHFLDSPEQALLVMVIWRDILPKSGGTFFAPDSVEPICKLLLNHPEGLPHNHPWAKEIHRCSNFREMTAEQGDIVIIHPFTLHTGSANPSGRIRYMNNKVISLVNPMKFNRQDGAYTPLEKSILNALGKKSIDFKIGSERVRSPGFEQLTLNS